jgi:hypothetical protein
MKWFINQLAEIAIKLAVKNIAIKKHCGKRVYSK